MPSNADKNASIASNAAERRHGRTKQVAPAVPARGTNSKRKTPVRRPVAPSSRVTRSQKKITRQSSLNPPNSTVSPVLPPPRPRQLLQRTDQSEANFLQSAIGVANPQRPYAPIGSQDGPIPAIDLRAVKAASRANARPLNSRHPQTRSTAAVTHAQPIGQVLVPGTQDAAKQPESDDGQQGGSEDDEEESGEDDNDEDDEDDEDDDEDDDDLYVPPSGRVQARSSLPGTVIRSNANHNLWNRPSSAPSSPLKRLDKTRKRARSPSGSVVDILDAHRGKMRRRNDGNPINIQSPNDSGSGTPSLRDRIAGAPQLQPPDCQPRNTIMGQRHSDGAIGIARQSLAARLTAGQRLINLPSRHNSPRDRNSRQPSPPSHHRSRQSLRTPRQSRSPRTPRTSRSSRSWRGGYRWDGKRRSHRSPRPWQLGYYTPAAQGVLQAGRNHVKQKVITENAFPDGQQKEAITREAWEVALHTMATLAANSSSLPNFNRHLNRMLGDVMWEERGRVISKARESVYIAFELAPPDILEDGNPRRDADHRRQLTIDMVHLHLATWKFLFGKYQMSDGRVRRNIPFTHKGLWDLIYRAYFDSKPSAETLAHMNPVPAAAIVLASTAAFCAIKEYETGEHKIIDFTRPRFSVTYEDLFEKWIQLETEKPSRAMNLRLRITAYCFERMGHGADPEPDPRRRPGRNDMFVPCGSDSEDDAPEQPIPSPQRPHGHRY